MDCDYNSTIKKIAEGIFKNNRDTIIEEWFKNVKEEAIITQKIEMDILRKAFERLVDDFIKYLPIGDFCSYYKSNEEIASTLVYNDVSFEKFIDIFHLFEDSYLPLLENLSNKDFREYITCLDKLHHKTIAIVTKKYFEVRDNIIHTLSKLIELRDCETADHLERTKLYSAMVAKELGQDDEFVESLYRASMLHDIGKVAVRDSILLKPGKLTFEEFEEIKKHTVIGAQAIDDIIMGQEGNRGYLLMARDIALYHHEKFDGSGYPEGLRGEEIPLSARILALVDAYDTITSKRPYKEALAHEEAVKRIVSDTGRHFDPGVVNAFLKKQEEFKKINFKREIELFSKN
jgi:HD-GYP domain-containing protein (c-di-GMP phosphodiesterase class II)